MSAFLTTVFWVGNCAPIFAQLPLRIDRITSSGFPTLRAYVDVFDGQGELLQGLSTTDFKVTCDGKPVKALQVQSFGESGEGLGIVLGIDASGTMAGLPLEAAKAAVLEFIADLGHNDRMAIVTFHDEVEIVSEFTDDRIRLEQRVKTIQAKGQYTELFRGISVALDLANATDLPGRRAVLIMSDGKDEGQESDLYNETSCVQKALTRHIPVCAIGFSRLERDSMFFLDVLKRVADRTRGTYHFAPSSGDLSAFYHRTRHQLLNQYVLTFDLSEVAGDSIRNIRVSAETSNGGVYDDLYVRLPFFSGSLMPHYLWGGGVLVLLGVLVFYRSKQKLKDVVNKKASVSTFGAVASAESTEPGLLSSCPRCGEALRSPGAVCPFCSIPTTPEDTSGSNERLDQERLQTNEFPVPERRTLVRSHSSYRSGLLRVKSGEQIGTSIELGAQEITIGRGSTNDLLLDDPTVSFNHAQIFPSASGLQLIDLGSTNGTFVNGQRIKKAFLEHKASIKLGTVVLVFEGKGPEK